MTVAAPCRHHDVIETSHGETSKVCRHHWRIETPHGETSEAVCELCPATRTFVNYRFPDYTIPPSKERDD